MPDYRVSIVGNVTAETPEEAARLVKLRYEQLSYEVDGFPMLGYQVENLASGVVCVIEDGSRYTLDEWAELQGHPPEPESPYAGVAVDDEDDEDDEDDGDELRRARSAGFQGDITQRLRGVEEAFAKWRLVVNTFEAVLWWAGNHAQPLLGVRYELSTDEEAAMRRSIRFSLRFRAADGALLASQDFFVGSESWDKCSRRAIRDGNVDLVDVRDYRRKLSWVDVVAEPLPGDDEDAAEVSLHQLEGLPGKVRSLLSANGISTAGELLAADLRSISQLTKHDRARIRSELTYLNFR